MQVEPARLIREAIQGHDPVEKATGTSRSSAVLIPIFVGDSGKPELLFIRRSDDLSTHPGQVAFPGGSREPGDADLCETALREAHEEVDLHPDDVEVLGPLNDMVTITGYHIRPYVGLVQRGAHTKVSSPEVAEVFKVPLSVLMGTDPAEKRMMVDGVARKFGVYLHGDHVIWGATAAILRGLLKLLKPYDPLNVS